MSPSGGKSSVLRILQAQKKFPGAVGAQVAGSNQVLTSMGGGVRKGEAWGSGITGRHPHEDTPTNHTLATETLYV